MKFRHYGLLVRLQKEIDSLSIERERYILYNTDVFY